MAQINLPIPTTQFERDLVLQLTTYLRDINNKLQATQGYLWNAPHPIMGSYHIWVSSTGVLRIKNGQPTSDTDGVVVGAQS
jgi:hypothetical protein